MEEIVVSRNGVQARYRLVEEESYVEDVQSPQTTIHDDEEIIELSPPRNSPKVIISQSPPRIIEEVRSPPKVVISQSPPRIIESPPKVVVSQSPLRIVENSPKVVVSQSPSRIVEEIIDPLIVPKFDSTLFYDAHVPPENKVILYTEMLKQNGPAILFMSDESATAFALERRFRIVQNVPFSYGNYLQIIKQPGGLFFGTKNRFESDDPFDLYGNIIIANSGSKFLILAVIS